MNVTGFDNASAIPEGTVLEKAHWSIPQHYSTGDSIETQAEALEQAIALMEKTIEQHRAVRGASYDRCPLPETIWIDLRWTLRFPESHRTTRLDTPVTRYTYESLSEAREALERLRTYEDVSRIVL